MTNLFHGIGDFIRIMLFSKMILLTPNPVDLARTKEFKPETPLKAITEGATIYIDVTSTIGPKPKAEGIVEFRERVNKTFPAGSIEAALTGKNGVKIVLEHKGYVSFSDNDVWLDLNREGGVPTGIQFDRVVITSRVELRQVKIIWKNWKE